jgi:Skp family chaperone for outer membrane proteins
MKKTLLITILLLLTTSVFAQRQNRFERIKALKTAYITEKVDLTSKEAEKFWPIYNKFEKDLHQLKVVRRRNILMKLRDNGGIDTISDSEAKEIKQEVAELRANIFTKEQEKYSALDKVLSAKKILKLYGAEESFKKELMRLLREQRSKKRF